MSFKPIAAGARTASVLINSNAVSSPHSISLTGTGAQSASNDQFTWPIDPLNVSNGHGGPCLDNQNDPQGCYWLSDSSENASIIWRDVQPFQHAYNSAAKGWHLGADYNLGSGSNDAEKLVYPSAGGIIASVLTNQCGWGNVVFVKHTTTFGVITTLYAHVNWLDSGEPAIGSTVNTATPLAKVGNGSWNNTACSKKKKGHYAYHLHFEVRVGDNINLGTGYTPRQISIGPQLQVDPNLFISQHR